MEGALSQSLHPPDFCCSPHSYQRFHEGSWSPWQTHCYHNGQVRLGCHLSIYCVVCLQDCSDHWYVERALTLVTTRTLTIAMAHASKGKMVTLPWTLNHSTGKESMWQIGFSDTTWDKATCGYAKPVCSLVNTKFEAIIKDAQEFMKLIHACNKDPTKVINIDDDDNDERACLVDNSSSDTELEKLNVCWRGPSCLLSASEWLQCDVNMNQLWCYTS